MENESITKKQQKIFDRMGMTDLDPVTERMLGTAIWSDKFDKLHFGLTVFSMPSLVDQSKIFGLQLLSDLNFVIIKQNDESIKLQREQVALQREQNDLQRKNNDIHLAILKELRYNSDKIAELTDPSSADN